MKPTVKTIIQVSVLIICAFFISAYFINNKEELKLVFELNPTYLIGLAFLNSCIHIFLTLEIYYLLKQLGLKNINLLEWFNIYSSTRFLNIHFAQAGNLYRSVQLKNKYNFSYTKTIAFLFLFSMLQIVFSILFAIFVTTFLTEPVYFKGIPLNLILIGVLATLLILTRVFLNIMGGVNMPQQKMMKINEFARNFVDSIMLILKDPKFMVVILFFNVLVFGLTTLQVFFSMKMVGIHLTLLQSSLFIIITLFSGLVSITPANLGITEFVYGFLTQYIGSTLGKGIIVAGVMRIINYVVILGFAAVCYLLAQPLKSHQNK